MRKQLVVKSPKNLSYFAELQNGKQIKKMDHLACFSAGLLALTSSAVDNLDHTQKDEYMDLAKGITNTCHESYIRTNTHLGMSYITLNQPRYEGLMKKKSNYDYFLQSLNQQVSHINLDHII